MSFWLGGGVEGLAEDGRESVEDGWGLSVEDGISTSVIGRLGANRTYRYSSTECFDRI